MGMSDIEKEAGEMSQVTKCRGGGGAASMGGTLWFIGFLFTIAFAKLVWWQILLGIIVWPYFLGMALRP